MRAVLRKKEMLCEGVHMSVLYAHGCAGACVSVHVQRPSQGIECPALLVPVACLGRQALAESEARLGDRKS